MKRGGRDSVIYLNRLLPMASALVLGFASFVPAVAQTAQIYRQQGDEFVRSKSWDDAIASYRKALELAPNDAVTHYDLAIALKNKGANRQAVDEFEAAVRLKPSWPEAHAALGATYYDLHEFPSALRELRKAVQLAPSDAASHQLLARIYVEQNDFASALAELTRAVTLKPSAELYFELGQVEGQQPLVLHQDAALHHDSLDVGPGGSVHQVRVRVVERRQVRLVEVDDHQIGL